MWHYFSYGLQLQQYDSFIRAAEQGLCFQKKKVMPQLHVTTLKLLEKCDILCNQSKGCLPKDTSLRHYIPLYVYKQDTAIKKMPLSFSLITTETTHHLGQNIAIARCHIQVEKTE